ARSVPLRNMSFQKTDGCSDQILLDLESGREQPITHAIVDPIHILLRPSTNGSYNPMEINAESGTTLLTFQPALRPDIADGPPAALICTLGGQCCLINFRCATVAPL